MLDHGCLGVLLHSGIDPGVDLEPVRVDVVVGSVLLLILCTPAIERIIDPSDGVAAVLILLPVRIIALMGLLGCHDLTDVLSEVGCCSVIVGAAIEDQLDRCLLMLGSLLLGEEAFVYHSVHYQVAPAASALLMATGVVVGGVLDHSHEEGRLLHLQILG